MKLGTVRTTNCVMTRALPMVFTASHTYIPESPVVVLTIVRLPLLAKLRLSGKLEKTRDHVTIGKGCPKAMHFGKNASFPFVTYITG